MNKKRICIFLILFLFVLSVPAEIAAAGSTPAETGTTGTATGEVTTSSGRGFRDVRAEDWFYTPVMKLFDAGIVSGMGDNLYAPRGTVTYGQALKLILMATNEGEQLPASRGGHWASGYLNRALETRILEQAVPLDGTITRLKIAEITAKSLGLAPATDASPFSDVSNGYATALYKYGILAGSFDQKGNRLYKPNDTITRAEMATVVYNLYAVAVKGIENIIPISTVQASRKMVGYYAAWAKYSGYTPDRIDATKLTHINYAFANIGSDNRIAMGYPDIDPGNFKLLNNLKKNNPALKTLISVGGWTWSARFSDAALTDASRTAFAESCAVFVKKYGFDGVDLDWEYPVGGGLPGNSNRPEDKRNFTLLLKALRERLDAQGRTDGKQYLLTIAGGAGTSFIKNTELSKIADYVDYASVMTYDIHGPWEPYTDLHAPLYNSSGYSPQMKYSADSAINAWMDAGFPKGKLVMGVPFYGYLYTSVGGKTSPAGAGEDGLYQTYSTASSIGYQDIVKGYLGRLGYTRYFHEQSKVPWLYNGSNLLCYEDPQSIGYKAEYIVDEELGGAMIWELSLDPDRVLLTTLYEGLH